MSHDEFTKLFNYLQAFSDSVDRRFDEVNKRFDSIFGLIDYYEKRRETQEQEIMVMKLQGDRYDRWIHELAEKIKYKLTPEY